MSTYSNLKVLIVDDVAFMRTKTKDALVNIGFTSTNIKESSNVDHGIALIKKFMDRSEVGFNLIISDYNMPDKNGFYFFKYLTKNGLLKETRFIILSSERDRSIVLELVKSGLKHFLLKPLDPIKLKEKMANLFEPKVPT